jgi:hypothetical protein
MDRRRLDVQPVEVREDGVQASAQGLARLPFIRVSRRSKLQERWPAT